MNILTVSHLNKRFGEQSAIVDLSFSVPRQAKKEIIRHLLATNPGLAMLLVTHDPEEVQLLTHFAMYFSTNFLGQYNLVETSQNNFRAVW